MSEIAWERRAGFGEGVGEGEKTDRSVQDESRGNDRKHISRRAVNRLYNLFFTSISRAFIIIIVFVFYFYSRQLPGVKLSMMAPAADIPVQI